MPVGTAQPYALVGVVGMLVIGHGAEIEDGTSAIGIEGDGLLLRGTGVDVDAGIIDVGAGFHVDGVAGFHDFHLAHLP